MTSFAWFRMPLAERCVKITQHHGEPEELFTYEELDGKEGFVFAPFRTTASEPVLLIHPEEITEEIVERLELEDPAECAIGEEIADRPSYQSNFAVFHDSLRQGLFRKLVLARSMNVSHVVEPSLKELFVQACNLYPRLFVALVSTPKSGVWLMATPEVLLAGRGNDWRTMALAGTMELSDEQLSFDIPIGTSQSDFPAEGRQVPALCWTDKNIQEQRYVATYIGRCLERFSDDFAEEGPYTTRAGRLVHLRSDFRFHLRKGASLGQLIADLHPTPAVCGIPKVEAQAFILQHEHLERRYYSGFAGPLKLQGQTSLFVSLRCMEINQQGFHLYAGGGLLRESQEEKEWEETVAKMETMRKVICRTATKPI